MVNLSDEFKNVEINGSEYKYNNDDDDLAEPFSVNYDADKQTGYVIFNGTRNENEFGISYDNYKISYEKKKEKDKYENLMLDEKVYKSTNKIPKNYEKNKKKFDNFMKLANKNYVTNQQNIISKSRTNLLKDTTNINNTTQNQSHILTQTDQSQNLQLQKILSTTNRSNNLINSKNIIPKSTTVWQYDKDDIKKGKDTYKNIEGDKCYDTYLPDCNNMLAELTKNTPPDLSVFTKQNFAWDTNTINMVNSIPPHIALNILKALKFKRYQHSGKIEDVNHWMQDNKIDSKDFEMYLNVLVSIVNNFYSGNYNTKQSKQSNAQPNNSSSSTTSAESLAFKNIGYSFPSTYYNNNVNANKNDDMNWQQLNRQEQGLNMLSLKNRPLVTLNPMVKFIMGSRGQLGGSPVLDKQLQESQSVLSCTSGISKILTRLLNKMKSVGYELDSKDEEALITKIKHLEELETYLNVIANNISKYTTLINMKEEQRDFNNAVNAQSGLVIPDVESAKNFGKTISNEINEYYGTLKKYDEKSTKLTSVVPILVKIIADFENKQPDRLIPF